MPGPIPNFPGAGPIGGFWQYDGSGLTSNAQQVLPDGSAVIGGYVLMSILAELRVHSQLLAVIANGPDNLQQLRSDAVADMGTLYAANPVTPVPSS